MVREANELDARWQPEVEPVGTGNFVILVIIAWMYSANRGPRFIEWISRGRYRAPRKDEYRT